ncbi:MAG: Gfo/Idh/MocA family oxidoreductase [Phycisphaeraceae bacterium]
MTSSKQTNVGMVGTKFMGRAHSNAYLKVSRFFNLPTEPVMHTVAARDPQGTAAFARQWGWARHTTRWQEMVADDAIDLVDICTPNNMHKDIAIAALEAGKHVACEKPLSYTLDEAREMRDAAKKARRRGAQSFVWFSYRGCPALALARQLVREGKIGQIYHVRANYLQGWAGPDTPLVWRFRSDVAGSGSHGDLGAHSIDAARFVTGDEITEICGSIEETFIKQRTLPADEGGNIKGKTVGKGPKKKGKVTVDDTVTFLARFKKGAVATFEATRFAIGCQNENKLEIHGEKGAIRWNFEDMNVLWYYDAGGAPETNGWRRIMATDADHHPFAHAWWPDAHVLGYEHGFINLSSTMFNSIGGKKVETPMPDFEDAYQTQRVLEAAVLSARNRSWIKMSDVK